MALTMLVAPFVPVTLARLARPAYSRARQINGISYYYRYDVYGRLVQVQDLGTATVNSEGEVTGELGPVLATYVYDALGRRVHETLGTTAGGTQTRYLYDVNWRVLEERDAVAAGQPLTKRYFWGTQALDELWAMDAWAVTQYGPILRRYMATRDLRHNVRTLVWWESTIGVEGASSSSSGTPGIPGDPLGGGPNAPASSGGGSAGQTVVVERYLYKPYGERIAINPANYAVASADDDPLPVLPYPLSPYGFQGLRHDVGTFLINVRHRHLDPVLGRWTQRDPTGYADGMNLYEAFASNPGTKLDPFGLESDGPAERIMKKIADFFARPGDQSDDGEPTRAILGIDPAQQVLNAARSSTLQPSPFDLVQPYVLPALQVAQGVGGAGQIVGGIVVIVATDGAGAPIGGVLVLRGADNLSAAGFGLYRGEYVPTTTFVALRRLTGSDAAATVSEIGIDVLSGFAAEGLLAELSAPSRSFSSSVGFTNSTSRATRGAARSASALERGYQRVFTALYGDEPGFVLGMGPSGEIGSGASAESLVVQFPAVSAKGEVNLLNVVRRGVPLTSAEASGGIALPGIGPETNQRFLGTLFWPLARGERLSGRGVGKLGDFVSRSYTLNEAGLAEFFGTVPGFEVPVPATAGSRTLRYLDLILTGQTGNVNIQFIRLQNGRIPLREVQAASDIQQRTGQPVIFIVTGER